MKTYVRALWLVLLATAWLFAACSRATEPGTAQKTSPQSGPSAPAISVPAETAPAPAPAPTPTKKEKAKPKPAAAKRPAGKKAEPPTATAAETPQPLPAPQQPQRTTAPPVVAESHPVPQGPQIHRITLPAGTMIPIRMIDAVDSKTDQVGQTFHASIDSDIRIENEAVVPKGADALLKLNRVTSAGAMRGQSELELQLDRIVVAKKTYPVTTNVIERAGASEGKKTAKEIGIGAAIGAAIGAITGGGKGAAIGAGVGAGSGAAVAAITKGEQVVVPSESRLEFRLQQPVVIEVLTTPFSN